MAKQLSLPQNDVQGQKARQKYLDKMKEIYEYKLNFDDKVAQLKKLTLREWNEPVLFLIILVKLILFIPMAIGAFLKKLIKGYPFPKYQDYSFLFLFPFNNPKFVDDFNEDDYFGLQRVSGINPLTVEKVCADKSNLPETFVAVKELVGQLTGQTYDEALADDRLYITNYEMLSQMTQNLKQKDGKTIQYTTDSIALYYRQNNGLLKPIAIQLCVSEPTSESNPIYTCEDGEHWSMAKTYVQNSDAVLAIMWTHTTHTHYLMESIIMATYRNLPDTHPLFALVEPQLKGTLWLDHVVHYFGPIKKGVNPPVADIMPGEEDMLLKFIGQGMRTYNFAEKAFPNDMKARQVEDPNLFYPYRDDGKLIWDALQKFVAEYVDVYYKSDEDVVKDFELQAWADEISGSLKEGKCEIVGFPTKFTSKQQVSETLGHIMFHASAHHSAIHYTLYQHIAYVPNMPLSIYEAPPTKKSEKVDLMGLLPNFLNMMIQVFGFYINCDIVIRLGEYKLNKFDNTTQTVIKKYQQRLTEISTEVQNRNKKRIFPYIYLDPKNVANSIIV